MKKVLFPRRVLPLLLAAALAVSLTVPPAQAALFDPPDVDGTGVILLNADTGQVYYEKNADTARPAASMTKLMSLYLVFDALEDGRLDPAQTIPASARAALISNSRGYSGHEALVEGKEYALEDLLRLVMTASCNGSMIAMAEYLAGDEAAFVQWMNETAASWGINARFADSCGLKDTGNAVSPRAMAEIARRLMADHPQILNYSTLKSTEFEGRTYSSTNTLLRTGAVAGMDGLKTGYTGGAGYCFTGTAQRDGTRMISVLMHTSNTSKRMSESQALLEYAFQRETQLALCAQADKAFTTTIAGTDSVIWPYTETKLTAGFSHIDAAQAVPCEVIWKVNGLTVSQETDDILLENGATSSVTFRPRAAAKANVTAVVRFPDGSVVETTEALPLSQEDITLTTKLSPAKTTFSKSDSLTVPCTVTSDQGLALSFAAGWYLDGKAVTGGQLTDFQVSPTGAASLTLKGADLTVGTHTLEFRCNTGKLPQLEQETANVTLTVRDVSSSWATEPIEAAIAADLVPADLQKNYTKAISRQQAAQMFVRLLEKSAGQDIDSILRSKTVSVNPAAFTDTKDKSVLAANALDILRGTGGGVFSPNSTLTRGQAAAILNRTAGVLGVDTSGYRHSFTDAKGWVDPELGWPCQAGILQGVGGNKFDPNGTLTNEQTIVIALRAYQVLSKPSVYHLIDRSYSFSHPFSLAFPG